MTKPVIQVRDLSKSYQIRSTTKKRYHSLRDDLMDGIKGLLKRPWQSQQTETFWALKDINFDVNQGDIVGIIGRNGAGKSTLLKILSQIVPPTSGEITIRGRIGSLLEVGTGFHPELTGRENIFMNGAVLGMKRLEISRKFDEIVAFAEVEKFLDTPVKFYSSGMYVRLAFAVAAHLEPEILIVDEVLAVGDAAFQKKCLGKMEDVGKEGRTVIFVSHNMQAVTRLTNRCIVLCTGQSKYNGLTSDAVNFYNLLSSVNSNKSVSYKSVSSNKNNHLVSALVKTSDENGINNWGEPITFEFILSIQKPEGSLCFSFQIFDDMQQPVCHFWFANPKTPNTDHLIGSISKGIFKLQCHIPKFRLYMGTYTLTTWLADRTGNILVDKQSEICTFEVSMRGVHRENYEWTAKSCAYIEEFLWEPIHQIDLLID